MLFLSSSEISYILELEFSIYKIKKLIYSQNIHFEVVEVVVVEEEGRK
jgi:hypothetical protein